MGDVGEFGVRAECLFKTRLQGRNQRRVGHHQSDQENTRRQQFQHQVKNEPIRLRELTFRTRRAHKPGSDSWWVEEQGVPEAVRAKRNAAAWPEYRSWSE